MSACAVGVPCKIATLRFQEFFATVTKSRSQGAAQNIPGTIYSNESGFFDSNWTTTNPTIAGAGYADFGTRLKADIQGVPAGAQVWVKVNGTQASLTSSETGAFSPVSPVSTIDGLPAAPLTVTNGAAIAVWEATSPNPAEIDKYDFPVWVVLPNQSSASAALSIHGALAPNPDDGAFDSSGGASAQPASYPLPRFASLTATQPAHSVLISPSTGLNTAPVTLTLTASDSTTLPNAAIVLRGIEVPDIPLQPVNTVSGQTGQFTANLTGAPLGPRDLVVSALSGVYTFPNVFSILAGCSFHTSRTPGGFDAAGGSGQIVVSATPPICTWSMSPDDSWITLGSQVGDVIQNFSIAPNQGPGRIGTITVTGKAIPSDPAYVSITQFGAADCTYTLSPASIVFPVTGGTATITITTQAGCFWYFVSTPSWVTASGSGTGSGTATISAGPNTGGLLSGAVFVGSSSLNVINVTQSASACGANDVTSQVKIAPGAFVSQPPTFSKFAQTITVTNTSGASIPGPVSLVFDGLPRSIAPCAANATCNIAPAPPITHCQSSNGSSIVTFAPGGLAPGQSASATLSFVPGASAGGSTAGLQYTPRVFSGTPNQ